MIRFIRYLWDKKSNYAHGGMGSIDTENSILKDGDYKEINISDSTHINMKELKDDMYKIPEIWVLEKEFRQNMKEISIKYPHSHDDAYANALDYLFLASEQFINIIKNNNKNISNIDDAWKAIYHITEATKYILEIME